MTLQVCPAYARLAKIDSAKPISVPSGLNKQQVKYAIASAVYPDNPAPELTSSEKMTDSALKALFWFRYKNVDASNHWFIEEIKPDSVIIGFNKDNYYFNVEYLIEENQIVQRIVDSWNLRQTEKEIHPTVFRWLGELETNVKKSMGRSFLPQPDETSQDNAATELNLSGSVGECKSLSSQSTSTEIIGRKLRELQNLRKDGVITENEFQERRQPLMDML